MSITHLRPNNLGIVPHPPEYREWAYQLWAYLGLTTGQIARRIAEPEEGDPHPAREIGLTIISSWKTRDDWSRRREEEMRQIAPDIYHMVMTNFFFSAEELSRFALRVAKDEEPLNTREQQGKAKLKILLMKEVFDRAGFIAWQANPDRSQPAAPPRIEDAPIASLDQGDLMQRWYQPAVQKVDALPEDEDA